ncbi:MAG: SusC/RagA family TonB-linked outer membrane protein [Bacteroidetes bacterium]|nr:SusC/RagA family TonB-linked outer membrane protein [Bacteroidota bacterium]
MRKSHLIIAFFLFFIGFSSNVLRAQSSGHTVTGKITDETGSPLGGVDVSLKTGTAHVLTNNAGVYTITAGESDSLVFENVGYIKEVVAVSGRSAVDLSLRPDKTQLNEAVVIGYQTVKRKDLTGATGIVNVGNSSKLSAGTAAESMQGLVPGVTVRNGGAPGQNSVIEIRGVGSFGNANPLYVIDGMISDANVTINPDDIASIQVLKDASASAIYGSRAGNGVVIITTKKGRNGEPIISANGKYGVQQMPKKWDVMDASQFLKTVQQEYTNSGVALPTGVAAQLANNTINTDWQKASYRSGAYQDYNIGVSGGSNTASYYIAGGYNSNDGSVIANTFNRASLRINTEIKKGILTFGENMMLSSTNVNNPGGGVNVFYNSAQFSPIIKVQGDEYKNPINYPSNPQGWGLGSSDNPTYANNYMANAALDKIHNAYGKMVGNAYAQVKFTNWLSYRFNAGLEVSYDYVKETRDTGVWRYTNQPSPTFVAETRRRFTNLLLEHTLNFSKSFGLHSINGVVGFSRTQQQTENTIASKTNLQQLNGTIYTTIGSALGTSSADGNLSLWRNHGWLGRVNYGYDDRYLLTLTGRIDQDSRFGSNYRTGYFPSAAVGWRLSREKFFKVDWVNELKLRASYGQLGFSDVLSPWGYIGNLNSSSRGVYGDPSTTHIGQYSSTVSNPDLHWEKREQKNIGFDANILNNAVTIGFDVYNSTSKDALLVVNLPAYSGASSSPYVNSGSIRNTGVELSLGYKNNSHPFKWEIAGNLTTIKNKVLSVGNQGSTAGIPINYLQPANYTRTQVGHAMGEWFVIQSNGLFHTQDEVNNYKNKDGKIIQPNAKPGDVKYVDANGDGSITDDDRRFRGSPWPTLQTGLQFNGYYKGFNINVQLIGVFGNKIYDDVRRALDSYQLTNFRKAINPWSASNPGGTDPRLAVDNGSDPSVSQNNIGQSDRWLENGSYVRLRNLEIGYSFSPSLLKQAGIKTMRAYVSGQNLLTITKYKGLDPDVANGNLIMRGMDSGFWPASRIFSGGISLEF